MFHFVVYGLFCPILCYVVFFYFTFSSFVLKFVLFLFFSHSLTNDLLYFDYFLSIFIPLYFCFILDFYLISLFDLFHLIKALFHYIHFNLFYNLIYFIFSFLIFIKICCIFSLYHHFFHFLILFISIQSSLSSASFAIFIIIYSMYISFHFHPSFTEHHLRWPSLRTKLNNDPVLPLDFFSMKQWREVIKKVVVKRGLCVHRVMAEVPTAKRPEGALRKGLLFPKCSYSDFQTRKQILNIWTWFLLPLSLWMNCYCW